jgi:hypothetical protein
MRKILYSPGYGAGWVSWASEKLHPLMIDYAPFIEHLEAGGDFACVLGHEQVPFVGDVPNWEMVESVYPEIIVRFLHLCWDKYGEVPYLGGMRNLKVAEVDGLVRIREAYDGYESYEVKGAFCGWI